MGQMLNSTNKRTLPGVGNRRDAVRRIGAGGLMMAGLGAAAAQAQRPPVTALWTHGNAVTVESPENLKLVRHIAWATELYFIPGRASWAHIPLPTPVILGDVPSKLIRFFLMFRVPKNDGRIRSVHLYDGPARIRAFDGLGQNGEHWNRIDGANTFTLDQPYEVTQGLGISFLFQADIGIDSTIPPPLLQISSAGGEYEPGRRLVHLR
jgi:hypothetical protein